MKTIIICNGFDEQRAMYDSFKKNTMYNVTMLSDSSGKGEYLYSIIIETKV